MAQLNFDASQVAPDTGVSDPVPAGWYNVMVDESEVKPTRDGMGARLAVRFAIMDGQYAKRKLFTGFNIRNANPVAQEIAFKQLSALAHAVGVLQVADSSQLHGIPLKVRVKVKAASGEYDASNDITAYKNINEQVDTGAAGGGVPAGFAPAPTGFAPQQQQQAATQAPAGFAPQQQAPQQQAAAPAPAQQQWQQPEAAQPWAQPPQQQAPQQVQQQPPQFQAPQQQAPQFQAPQQVQQQVPQQQAPQPMQADPAQVAGAASPPWQQPAQ